MAERNTFARIGILFALLTIVFFVITLVTGFQYGITRSLTGLAGLLGVVCAIITIITKKDLYRKRGIVVLILNVVLLATALLVAKFSVGLEHSW